MKRWKLSEQHIENFIAMGRFSKKCKNCFKNFQLLRLYAVVTQQWLQTAGNSLPNGPSTDCLVFTFAFFNPDDKIFKILFQKFTWRHRLTLLCSNVVKFFQREIGEIVHYLPHKIKFWLPHKLSLLCRSRPKSARVRPQHLAHTIPDFVQIGLLSAEL